MGKTVLGDCVIFGNGGMSCTLTVTTKPGANVSATLGNKTLSTIANASGIAVLTLKEEGIWTVTATDGVITRSVNVDSAYRINTPLSLADPVLANNSWETISRVAKSGLASTLWNIGDTKTFTIGTETYTAQIVDFDHYVVADSASYGRDTAGITFHLTEITTDSYVMNNETTVGGGWGSSTLRTFCNGSLLTSFDSTLQSAIATVLTPYTAGKTTDVTVATDKVFVPSEYEVFGAVEDGYAAEGTQFKYYALGNSAKKIIHGNTFSNQYWTRSVYKGNGTLFIAVSASATLAGSSPSSKLRVCPVFCV